jgi:uncharacterized protein (UPF0276 family)
MPNARSWEHHVAGEGLPERGVGLGLRRAHLEQFTKTIPAELDIIELAPENWIEVGGRLGKQFKAIAAKVPIVCHGLSLNLGGPAPLDLNLLTKIQQFLDVHGVRYYSEHLSYCADSGQLYDLLPIPFTEEAVLWVAARIRRIQTLIERRIAVENIAYYCTLAKPMSELEFINAVVAEADCDLLLDVNNVYVNSINHGYDAEAFMRGLPAERVVYVHVAGHGDEAEDLKIDTHGAAVSENVWRLLEYAYQIFGARPTVLERDFNLPPLAELLDECRRIKELQTRARRRKKAEWPLGEI